MHVLFSRGLGLFVPCVIISIEAISVKKCADIAAAFQMDGVRGRAIQEFSKRSAERDMFRWILAFT